MAFPLAAEVHDVSDAPRPLTWVALDELVEDRRLLLDGHLRILALRAAHAMEIL